MTPKDIEELQCIESQMAMLSVVSKMGYEKYSHEIIKEHLQQDTCDSLFNTIGTNVFVETWRKTKFKKEELISLFEPIDFEAKYVKEKIATILNLALHAKSSQVETDKDSACLNHKC